MIEGETLAKDIAERVHARRLRRIGERPPYETQQAARATDRDAWWMSIPPDERRNWIDMAECALEAITENRREWRSEVHSFQSEPGGPVRTRAAATVEQGQALAHALEELGFTPERILGDLRDDLAGHVASFYGLIERYLDDLGLITLHHKAIDTLAEVEAAAHEIRRAR